MKKILMILAIMAVFLPTKAQEIQNFREWLDKTKWETPHRTGIKSVDDLYDMSDDLYKSIEEMVDSVPMYSLRSIVENGDTTAIVVVDQYNKPYSSWSAVSQMVSGGAYLTSITTNAVTLSLQYANLILDLPNIVASKGLGSFKIIGDVRKHSKVVGKIAKEFLPQLKVAYSKRGNPIKAYNKAQSKMKESDGFVTTGFDHVPEFSPDDMPTDEELDMLLEQERNSRKQ